jgi:hypothetical protein
MFNKIILQMHFINYKHKVSLLALMSFLVFSFNINAQETTNESEFWKHVRFGGGIGLNFGDGFFGGSLSPSAIYQFNDITALGLGLNVSYFSQEHIHKSTVFGSSLIGLINPMDFAQLSIEFEQVNVNRDFDQNFVSNIDTNYWYPALFFGAGYRNGNMAFGIRYDVLYDNQKSIYADAWMPFFRVFF